MSSRRRPAHRKSLQISWIAYKLGGAKAALLGHVEAPNMETAIAAAAAEFRVPANRILVRPTG